MSLYDADAEYRVGKMYFDAGKWKEGFPFILKSADMGCEDAIELIIEEYNLQKDPKFFKDYKNQFQQNVKNNGISSSKVSRYYQNAINNKTADINMINDAPFILAFADNADKYYKRRFYRSAYKCLNQCIASSHFKLLSNEKKGQIYNNMSLCGWFLKNDEWFKKYNALALEQDLPIAFNNRANAFFTGKMLCTEPDYKSALFWYQEALDRTDDKDENYSYITDKIAKCKEKLNQ